MSNQHVQDGASQRNKVVEEENMKMRRQLKDMKV